MIAHATTEERFWSKVSKTNDCWLWIGARRKRQGGGWGDYGSFRFNGKTCSASRIAWELTHGPIPDGLCVLHRCDNPPCCNPTHLFLGTVADNALDKANKGRVISHFNDPLRRPHQNNSGENNPNAKLTNTEVKEISERYRLGGITQKQLQRDYGVSRSAIQRILHGISWRKRTPEDAFAAIGAEVLSVTKGTV
jgi:hypothetical protein